jgi:hypothetical protein
MRRIMRQRRSVRVVGKRRGAVETETGKKAEIEEKEDGGRAGGIYVCISKQSMWLWGTQVARKKTKTKEKDGQTR